ncbi:MAG: S-methyl-5-thioribose-1-phosphate isomerase [Chloroflexia bacterium]
MPHDVPQPVEYLPGGSIKLVDQTLLPLALEYVHCGSIDELAEAIRVMKVRGAPAIGIAAAYGLALAAGLSSAPDIPSLLADIEAAARTLRATRPTAVNLPWALDTVMSAAHRVAQSGSVPVVKQAVYDEAARIDTANREANLAMGEHGAALLEDGMNVLTHCNTGPLAAGGIGTALGVIYTAHRQGKRLHVWVDETRPLLQGARLTAWELLQWDIPCTLIADSMAASLMRAGRVDAVLLGADRIVANGDLANKIGTYSLAVLAGSHTIPFYSAAPTSTLDLSIPTGHHITIEERHPDELTHHRGSPIAPTGMQAYNPAFDVTPSNLIDAIITEAGIARPPYEENLIRISAGDQVSGAREMPHPRAAQHPTPSTQHLVLSTHKEPE